MERDINVYMSLKHEHLREANLGLSLSIFSKSFSFNLVGKKSFDQFTSFKYGL